jgi:ABC-type multidrug transport system fused ATPase/permease subunit
MGGEVYALSEDLRGNFVYVPQGNTLMSGSIRYNLLLAKPDASESELQRVLTLACAEFVYDLPQGLDTELSERGGGLSEGQAQRLAIARGLLRPGNIMLFDEISSALDEETERELYRRLFTELRDKTMIIVTHRTAMLDLCDDVVRL